jgi:hypothetical protein
MKTNKGENIMTLFEKMTEKERKAFNYVYKKAETQKKIQIITEGYNSTRSRICTFFGFVPAWVCESLYKYKGCNKIASCEKSYLAANISFGVKKSNQNLITFTVHDYIHNS